MDEQRMLAEIERQLAAENPGLASDLTSFRKPGRLSVFRSTRARVIGSLFTVAVVAMVSLMVYAMLPFRSGARTAGHHPVTTTSTSSGPGQAKIGAAPGGSSASSSTAKTSTAKTSTAKTSTASSASAQPSASKGKAASTNPSAQAAAGGSGTPASARSGSSASASVHGP
jgi:cytoskeletal protein RodZ